VILVQGKKSLADRLPLVGELILEHLLQFLETLLKDSLSLGVLVIVHADLENLLILLCLALLFGFLAFVYEEELGEEKLLKFVETEAALGEQRFLF
jgi:hypothetical protein